MPRARMSVQHDAWLAALIELYGADFLMKRIKKKKSGKGPGRRAHPIWAKRMRSINFFRDVLKLGTGATGVLTLHKRKAPPPTSPPLQGQSEFRALMEILLRGGTLDKYGWRKVNEMIESVARGQKPPMDTATARRKFRRACATFRAWSQSGQKRLDAAWPQAPML
jgi:hypothetical protein